MALPAPILPLRYPPGLDESAYDLAAPAVPGPLPRITVVTPSYNQAAYLETTIRSVLKQGYPNLDYVVMDGGSKDDSRRVIEHYAAHLSSWVSEKDGGQADAINKGVTRGNGEWFNWINSDDVLAPGALWRVAAAAQAGIDYVAGDLWTFNDRERIDRVHCHGISARAVIAEGFPDEGGACTWQQPSGWMKLARVREIGLSRELHWRFDHALMMRYLARGDRVAYCEGDVLAYFRLHDLSKTVSAPERFDREHLPALCTVLDDPAVSAELRPHVARLVELRRWRDALNALADDGSRSRFARLAQLAADVRVNPALRCNRDARKTARRILLRGGRRQP